MSIWLPVLTGLAGFAVAVIAAATALIPAASQWVRNRLQEQTTQITAHQDASAGQVVQTVQKQGSTIVQTIVGKPPGSRG